MFILPNGVELTMTKLQEFITKHKNEVLNKYTPLKNLYEGNHEILSKEQKAAYKPDNRIVVNFAKYIIDTLNGYFIGIPIKIDHENDQVAEYLDFIDTYNNQDDNNAELSKMCSIYGHAYELLFMDENAEVGITCVSPEQAFVIYDESIIRRPLYGVRYYKNANKKLEGSYSDGNTIVHFDENFKITSTVPHYFGGVPLVEYKENEERIGAFESVKTMINAYNKALSEKANDVDYYADAYLKILGAKLDEKTLQALRDSRIINLEGEDADKVIVEFMGKPEADTAQENLINRLERLIFQIAMVANINEENFGNASGISLAYKLQAMSNLAKTKERKFIAGLNKRYKLISNIPSSKIKADEWTKIKYTFTRNTPKNLLEEAQIAQNLSGITSEETQLSVLSIVDNVKEEIEKKESSIDLDVPFRGIEDNLESNNAGGRNE